MVRNGISGTKILDTVQVKWSTSKWSPPFSDSLFCRSTNRSRCVMPLGILGHLKIFMHEVSEPYRLRSRRWVHCSRPLWRKLSEQRLLPRAPLWTAQGAWEPSSWNCLSVSKLQKRLVLMRDSWDESCFSRKFVCRCMDYIIIYGRCYLFVFQFSPVIYIIVANLFFFFFVQFPQVQKFREVLLQFSAEFNLNDSEECWNACFQSRLVQVHCMNSLKWSTHPSALFFPQKAGLRD